MNNAKDGPLPAGLKVHGLKRMLDDIAREVELTREYLGKEALDARVLDVMGQVPRHEFVPAYLRNLAYCNGPAPIGLGQTISQPYIVALMTDLLNTKPSDVMLEIGTGSGYQAAILSKLVAQVYSIEIIGELAKNARKRLHRLGYGNVTIISGNGYHGWPEHAPYDGIVVTAAAPHIPEALLEQLKVGARLVIPIGFPYDYQELVVLEKHDDNKIDRQAILGVSFVPLTGIHNNPLT